MKHCPRRWRKQAVRRYSRNRLRPILLTILWAEALTAAWTMKGDEGGPPMIRWESSETIEEQGPESAGGEHGFSRLGIRFRLEDGTLWFYRETIDTH